jgi:hypothetical protein
VLFVDKIVGRTNTLRKVTMNKILTLSLLLASLAMFASAQEWKPLFDGKSLAGWDGDPKFWTVKDGAITGTTTKENPTTGNTFVIYTGASANNAPVEFGDFELKLKFRIEAHNSGIQYRSFLAAGQDRWRVGGYQSDFDAGRNWAGTNYGERFRGILAKRGEKVVLTGTEAVKTKRGKRTVAKREIESLGDAKELAAHVKPYPEWNEMLIVAKGFHFVQKINGVTMSELTDNDEANRRDKGLIAVQLHGGAPMVVQVKDVQIKQ